MHSPRVVVWTYDMRMFCKHRRSRLLVFASFFQLQPSLICESETCTRHLWSSAPTVCECFANMGKQFLRYRKRAGLREPQILFTYWMKQLFPLNAKPSFFSYSFAITQEIQKKSMVCIRQDTNGLQSVCLQKQRKQPASNTQWGLQMAFACSWWCLCQHPLDSECFLWDSAWTLDTFATCLEIV